MPAYKVKSPGFFGGIYREPDGRHDPVVTAEPIPKDQLPSWLEPIKQETASKAGRRKAAAKTTTPNEKPEDFMGDDSGVETL